MSVFARRGASHTGASESGVSFAAESPAAPVSPVPEAGLADPAWADSARAAASRTAASDISDVQAESTGTRSASADATRVPDNAPSTRISFEPARDERLHDRSASPVSARATEADPWPESSPGADSYAVPTRNGFPVAVEASTLASPERAGLVGDSSLAESGYPRPLRGPTSAIRDAQATSPFERISADKTTRITGESTSISPFESGDGAVHENRAAPFASAPATNRIQPESDSGTRPHADAPQAALPEMPESSTASAIVGRTGRVEAASWAESADARALQASDPRISDGPAEPSVELPRSADGARAFDGSKAERRAVETGAGKDLTARVRAGRSLDRSWAESIEPARIADKPKGEPRDSSAAFAPRAPVDKPAASVTTPAGAREVHLTIDRIDLAPPPAPPERPRRPEPRMTLERYRERLT